MEREVRRLGNAEITYLGWSTAVHGTDFDGGSGAVGRHRWRVELATKLALIADWIMWSRQDGAGDVRVQWLEGRESEGCPRHYHRLGVYPHPEDDKKTGRRVMMLRLVGPKRDKPDQTTLRKASLEEIAEAAGVDDVEQVLLDWGAEKVGRRDALGWSALRKDAFMGVRSPAEALWVPIAALTLCAILPLR